MPISKEFGTWHIETHFVTVTIQDAAGFYDSASINLNRSGRLIGAAITPSFGPANDNVQAIGFNHINWIPSAAFVYGQPVTGFSIRVNKEAGTAGQTNVSFVVTILVSDEKDA